MDPACQLERFYRSNVAGVIRFSGGAEGRVEWTTAAKPMRAGGQAQTSDLRRSDEELLHGELELEMRLSPPLDLATKSENGEACDGNCPERDQCSLHHSFRPVNCGSCLNVSRLDAWSHKTPSAAA